MFQVGQKVVCIDADRTNDFGINELSEGAVYTVSWVGRATDAAGSYLGICVSEHKRMVPMPFGCGRFRPITERKTDISDLVRIAQDAARSGRVLA